VSDARSTLYQDLFGLDGLLTEEEREVRERVRAFSDAEVIPIMADCWERGEFPFQLVPKLAALSICGDTIKGYGCAGLSAVGAGLAAMELARGDGSIYTFFGATSGFAINTIFNLGSEDQKEKWIPGMARLEKLGAFALTEPEHGSDAVMIVRARRSGNILRRLPRRADCRLRVGRTLTIRDVGSEYLSKTVVSHQAGILACAFSPNGSRIVAASDDRTLKIWDATVCTFFLLRSMERVFMHPRCSGTQPS
jgi:hypothetical protein